MTATSDIETSTIGPEEHKDMAPTNTQDKKATAAGGAPKPAPTAVEPQTPTSAPDGADASLELAASEAAADVAAAREALAEGGPRITLEQLRDELGVVTDGLVVVTLAHHWSERVLGEDGQTTIVDHLPGDKVAVHPAVAADLEQAGYRAQD